MGRAYAATVDRVYACDTSAKERDERQKCPEMDATGANVHRERSTSNVQFLHSMLDVGRWALDVLSSK